MFASLSLLLLGSTALARPYPNPALAAPLALRTVTSLDQAATAEAQQRDNTATRAFTAQQIKTSDGKCFSVDPLSGDFRENLTPVQIKNCDGSAGQQWDVITAGKHNNVAGNALIVSTLTNACLNFDPRRAAGNQVLLFSCGGRADGGGQVTDSQLFAFAGSASLSLQPKNSAGTCLAVAANGLLDQAKCDNSAGQTFTIGGNANKGSAASSASSASATVTASATAGNAGTEVCDAVSTSTSIVTVTVQPTETASSVDNSAQCQATQTVTVSNVVTVTVTAGGKSASASASAVQSASSSSVTAASTTVNVNLAGVSSTNPTQTISVSRAGTVLNPTAAAEANTRDDTATRAFSGVSLKSSDGRCLFIDATAGDFRENLIPVQLKDCDGSDNEKFDIITAGKHNNAQNSALVVSTLTQGCLNFDDRRAAGDKVIMFSCGGRADGEGQTTDSQLFPFAASNTASKTILLAPENSKNKTCLVPNGNLLDASNCSGGSDQLFTIV